MKIGNVVDEIKLILETINDKMSGAQTLSLAKLIYAIEVLDGPEITVCSLDEVGNSDRESLKLNPLSSRHIFDQTPFTAAKEYCR